jgi:hypothetical protein
MAPGQWVTGILEYVLVKVLILSFGHFSLTLQPQWFVFIKSFILVVPSLLCGSSVD